MKTMLSTAVCGVGLLMGVYARNAAGQEKPAAPARDTGKAAQEEKHQHDVQEHGDHVMGFSHDKATHHFRLYADGGAIEVGANDAKDTSTREAIRGHFTHIVKMFAAGDFTAPILIHSQNPPGAETMKRLRGEIAYRLEKTEQGARIRISTKNAEAVQAVHGFLRFQISEHQTGDSGEVVVEGKA